MYKPSKLEPLSVVSWLVSALVHIGVFAAVSLYSVSTHTPQIADAQHTVTVLYTRVDQAQPSSKQELPKRKAIVTQTPPSVQAQQNYANPTAQPSATVATANTLNTQVSVLTTSTPSTNPVYMPTLSSEAQQASQAAAISSAAPHVKEAAPALNTPLSSVNTSPLPKRVTKAKLDPAYADNNKRTFTNRSRLLGEEGTVLLSVIVTATGHVKHAAVKQSSGYAGIDQSAADDAKSWRFIPATLGDQAVEDVVLIPALYKLLD